MGSSFRVFRKRETRRKKTPQFQSLSRKLNHWLLAGIFFWIRRFKKGFKKNPRRTQFQLQPLTREIEQLSCGVHYFCYVFWKLKVESAAERCLSGLGWETKRWLGLWTVLTKLENWKKNTFQQTYLWVEIRDWHFKLLNNFEMNLFSLQVLKSWTFHHCYFCDDM